MAKNYYIILGVEPDATQDDIKAAYRRQAKHLHPDVADKDSAPFLEMQEAYNVLHDPARRRAYDESIRIRQMPHTSGRSGPEPLHPEGSRVEPLIPEKEPVDLGDIMPGRSFHTSFEGMFDRLWSNFSPFSRSKAERIEHRHVEIPLTREQALHGGQVRVMVPARMRCLTCQGYGDVGGFECGRCAGTGVFTEEYPVSIAYPAGLFNDYSLHISLERLGIHDFDMIVHFRVSEMR
jgi:DnaJ-class molecular chaperone